MKKVGGQNAKLWTLNVSLRGKLQNLEIKEHHRSRNPKILVSIRRPSTSLNSQTTLSLFLFLLKRTATSLSIWSFTANSINIWKPQTPHPVFTKIKASLLPREDESRSRYSRSSSSHWLPWRVGSASWLKLERAFLSFEPQNPAETPSRYILLWCSFWSLRYPNWLNWGSCEDLDLSWWCCTL